MCAVNQIALSSFVWIPTGTALNVNFLWDFHEFKRRISNWNMNLPFFFIWKTSFSFFNNLCFHFELPRQKSLLKWHSLLMTNMYFGYILSDFCFPLFKMNVIEGFRWEILKRYFSWNWQKMHKSCKSAKLGGKS